MPIDYKKYPKNWKSEIVPRILKRAKNKCEFCHLKNGQTVYSAKFFIKMPYRDKIILKNIWFSEVLDLKRIALLWLSYKKVKVVLTIAHLDHDSENHKVKDSRLKALCQYCHLNYDSEHKKSGQ